MPNDDKIETAVMKMTPQNTSDGHFSEQKGVSIVSMPVMNAVAADAPFSPPPGQAPQAAAPTPAPAPAPSTSE